MSKALPQRRSGNSASSTRTAVQEAIDEYFPLSVRRALKERVQRQVAEQSQSTNAFEHAVRRMADRVHGS